jgi:hypothetical protein
MTCGVLRNTLNAERIVSNGRPLHHNHRFESNDIIYAVGKLRGGTDGKVCRSLLTEIAEGKDFFLYFYFFSNQPSENTQPASIELQSVQVFAEEVSPQV